MEINKEVKHDLTWHSNDGKFNVTIINGVITELAFCELGTGAEDGCTRCLNSIDYKFLKQVHECLGDVFTHLEKEAKLNGHSFAGEDIKLSGIDLLIDKNAQEKLKSIKELPSKQQSTFGGMGMGTF